MKKHIFGVALFSFIVASFAFVYAFFYAPSIPPKEAVKPPVSQTEIPTASRTYCNLRKNKLSSEVISSTYYLEENKIVSKIRVSLNETASVPSKIYVSTTFSSVGNIGKDGFGYVHIVENPFAGGREQIVTVVSNVTASEKLKFDENLYVLDSVTDYDSSTNYKKSDDVSQAKSVLFVFGKSPINKSEKIIRGRISD